MIAIGERLFSALDPRIDYFDRGAPRQNFGDYLPELIALEMLGTPRVDADIYRLIGSVIAERWIRWDLSRANGVPRGLMALWLCGARTPNPLTAETRAMCRFFGVRGPLTRDALQLPPDTVMGDPGLLAPLFHQSQSDPSTAGKAICLPHVYDPRTTDDLLALSGADVLIHPEIEGTEVGLRTILNQISSAEFVLSGSLHGAIIACAYGVPFAFWDTGHVDAPFKWQDFAGSVGIPCRFAADLAEGRALWASSTQPVLALPPLTPMLDVCPFTVRPSVLVQALAHDRRIDGEAAKQVASELAQLPGSRLFDARELNFISADNRQKREQLRGIVIKRSLLTARRIGRVAAPQFIKRMLRTLRLRGS